MQNKIESKPLWAMPMNMIKKELKHLCRILNLPLTIVRAEIYMLLHLVIITNTVVIYDTITFFLKKNSPTHTPHTRKWDSRPRI